MRLLPARGGIKKKNKERKGTMGSCLSCMELLTPALLPVHMALQWASLGEHLELRTSSSKYAQAAVNA